MTSWKHAIITGAGSGLGLGLAMRLLARGTCVTVLDLALSEEHRAALEATASNNGGRWQFIPADVTAEAQMRTAVDKAVLLFGKPDLAINSAGIGLSRAFANTTADDFRRVVEINLMGSYHFAAAMFAHLEPGSRLALMASMAGLVANYGYAAYGASKFGVVGLASTLRAEWEPLGIHVSCICPPEVKTPLVTAERVSGDPVGLELKQLAGSLDVDSACDKILAALDAGRWMIIPGFSAKITALVAQRMPRLFHQIAMPLVRRTMRKHGVQVVN